MALATISNGMAFVLLALSVPIPAEHDAPVLESHDFDLAAVTLVAPRGLAAAEPAERLGKPRLDATQLAALRWTPPSKTWGNPARGPVFQVGALGSKDKRIPDLAHVSFDWDF